MGTLPLLIAALHDPRRFDHPVERVELVETHISWVLLAGDFAYKIKKPVDLGFLDFSNLAKRRFNCEEELRLNRRLAPELYLGVVTITGRPDDPQLSGQGEPIEYAVKMRRFAREQELDRLAAQGRLTPAHIDDLIATLAAFHQRIEVAGPDSPYGTPEAVYLPVAENFSQIGSRLESPDPPLDRLRAWSEAAGTRLNKVFTARRRDGFVRECHGDAHLANMVLLDDVQEHEYREGQGRPGAANRVTLFDCLEFNPALRWIDVMSELAFLVMDLEERGHPELARRALNGYLEHSGDYAGLAVLRFYLVYRALVRAKVAMIRLRQPGLLAEEQDAARAVYRGYVQLAEDYTHVPPPWMVITHGPSGAGKTWIAQRLLETCGAIRVRSDIERKRLHGLAPLARSRSQPGAGLYTTSANDRTYGRLAELAGAILDAGFAVIVDATFLERARREQLRAVARARNVRFMILNIQAPEQLLHERVGQRDQQARDASEAGTAVLEWQLAHIEPLAADEQAETLTIFNDGTAAIETRLRELAYQLNRA
jgi:aminoglycoside phosphotransferase family enzyme/gluconate kinase